MPSSRTSQEWSQLVNLVLQGDESALSEFAGDVGLILYRFLAANGMSPADAEELAVSCTSDIVMALDRYEEKGRFEAWMFQVVRNRRIDEFRGKTELVLLVESDWLELYEREQSESDDQVFHSNDKHCLPVYEALEDALSKLPATDRRLIEGRHAPAPLSFEVLGQELGMTAGNARIRFHRVTKKLKAALLTDDRIQNWLGGASPLSPSSTTPLTNET